MANVTIQHSVLTDNPSSPASTGKIPVGVPAGMAHLWTSYRFGYGQSVISVLAGVGLVLLLAGVVFWRIAGAAHGGRDPAGALAAFAAGLGLLIAQAVLLRRIEADPKLGRLIED